MKKYVLLFSLAVAGICAKAQYFQHLYGSPDLQQTISGVNTFIQPQGHLMASENNISFSAASNLIVTYTDVNGDILSAPNFNNEYTISDLSGTVLDITSVNVFELENGSGFGAVGLFNNGTGAVQGIFYLQLDPTGNPTNIFSYTPVPLTVAWYNLISVSAVAKSPGTDDLYITGSTETSLSQNFIYALKINTVGGNILWSGFYDVIQVGFPQKEYSNDIIESPYMPTGQPEVVIVGGGYDYNSTSNDAIFFRLNANSGAPIFPWAFFYGTAATNEQFTSIDIANSTAGGTNGFIIGGVANMSASNADFWLMKSDPVGGTVWSSTYDYTGNPGNANICQDVKERFNTLSQYEYYACGTTYNGTIGGADLLVIKTDDLGNGVPNGEFAYNTGNDDLGFSLDQYNGTPADGLSIFGISYSGGIGLSDEYLIKSYFNGLSGCNETFSTPSPQPGPGLYSETGLKSFDFFTLNHLMVSSALLTDVTLCYNTSITGGDNSRMAPAEPKGDKEAVVSPNPMQQGSPIAVVELETETPAVVQITIYDMLGKQYYNAEHELIKGKNQLPISLSNTNMAAGMYTVKISGTTVSKNILLMVK